MMRTKRSLHLESSPAKGEIQLPSTPLKYAEASQSLGTRKAYAQSLKAFATWCMARRVRSYPTTPELLASYLSELAGAEMSLSTIKKSKAAIDGVHRAGDEVVPGEDPRVRMVMRGITRQLGSAPTEQKSPLLVHHLREIVGRLPSDLKGTRDRALLLVSFAGAFRKSEVINLKVADLSFEDEGVRIRLRRSKTDQAGAGATIGLARGTRRSTCPVRALEEWLAASGITEGPLFRAITRHGHLGVRPLSAGGFTRIIKTLVEEAGLDVDAFSPHSLRAGFCTEAAANGVEERIIAKQSRHTSMGVLRGYIREADLFKQNASAKIGL